MYELFGQNYRVATLSTFNIKNHYTEVEIDKTILMCQNSQIKKAKNIYV